MELSYEQKRSFLMTALDPNNNYAVWVKDIYPDKVIVDDKGKLYEIGYTITDNKVSLGDRKEVMVTYEALAELKDIEIFQAGTYRGKTYTEDDLTAMVKNFGELKEKIKPTMVIGHSEDQKLLQDSGLPAAGWMDEVKKVGSKLVASFKDVPKVVADLITKGAYKRISSEIYNNFEDKGLALRRVALLGGEIPEVKTLQDVAALYADTGETTWICFNEPDQSPKKKGEDEMKTEIEKFQEQLTQLSEQVNTLKTENETLKTEKAQVVTKLSEREKIEKTGKVREMVKPLRDSGLAPAVADRLEAFSERLDSSKVEKFGEKEITLFEEFGGILEGMFKRNDKGTLVVQFGECATGASHDGVSDVAKGIASASPKK